MCRDNYNLSEIKEVIVKRKIIEGLEDKVKERLYIIKKQEARNEKGKMEKI